MKRRTKATLTCAYTIRFTEDEAQKLELLLSHFHISSPTKFFRDVLAGISKTKAPSRLKRALRDYEQTKQEIQHGTKDLVLMILSNTCVLWVTILLA